MDLTTITFINFLGSIQILSLLISIECFVFVFFQLINTIVIILNPICYITAGTTIYGITMLFYNLFNPESPQPYMILPTMDVDAVIFSCVLTIIFFINHDYSIFNLSSESVNKIFKSILDNMNIQNNYENTILSSLPLKGNRKIHISERTKWLPYVRFSIENFNKAAKNEIIDRFKKELSNTTIERESRFFTILFYSFLGILFLLLAFYKHIF